MSVSLEPLRDSSAASSTASPESSAMLGAKNLVSSPFNPQSVSRLSFASCRALYTPTQGRHRVQHGVSARPAQAAIVTEVNLHEAAVVLEQTMQRGLERVVLPIEPVVRERKLRERRVGLERRTDASCPRRGDIRCILRAGEAEHAKSPVAPQYVAERLCAGIAQLIARQIELL
eukprot:7391970-Prymnesium_polylepis.1